MRRVWLVVMLFLLTGGNAFRGTFWLPPRDSTTAADVDWLFYFILYVATFFFVLINILMIAFVFLYRRRPGVEPQPSPSHNTPLEIAWSVIPLGIVILIFYLGFVGYMDMRVSPRQAFDIRVEAKKWSWNFKYPNGFEDSILHVPADEPVRLTMSSQDVIHGLFIPDFRMKMDVVPGRYNTTWFRAKKPGEHDLYCSEYCGTGHSTMITKVKVYPRGEFRSWLKKEAEALQNLSPAEAGERLYLVKGCRQCHSVDGSPKVGPTLKGVYGKPHFFRDGTSAEVEDNYLRESILDPSIKVREGYTDQMPSFKGILSDNEITNIIEYIKSLSDAAKADSGESGTDESSAEESSAEESSAEKSSDEESEPEKRRGEKSETGEPPK